MPPTTVSTTTKHAAIKKLSPSSEILFELNRSKPFRLRTDITIIGEDHERSDCEGFGRTPQEAIEACYEWLVSVRLPSYIEVNRGAHGVFQWSDEKRWFVPRDRSLLPLLEETIKNLPLLLDTATWQSLNIDYEWPLVERVWTEIGEHRLCLHVIHRPAINPQAHFHPHPWPSAMKIIEGSYKMMVGYGAGDEPPPPAATMVMTEGSSYEMVNIDGWHSVMPLTPLCWTIMLTGKPWGRTVPKHPSKLKSLSPARMREIQNFFRVKFDVPIDQSVQVRMDRTVRTDGKTSLPT